MAEYIYIINFYCQIIRLLANRIYLNLPDYFAEYIYIINFYCQIPDIFKEVVKDEWLDNNFSYIKKTFRKSTKKYDNKEYYNIYLLMITIMKQLLGSDILNKCKYKICKEQIFYYIFTPFNI